MNGHRALVLVVLLAVVVVVSVYAERTGTSVRPSGQGGGAGAVAARRPARASHAPDRPPATVDGPASSADVALPVGPGPQAPYRVQPQPDPGTCRYRVESGYPLPDPACTPGAVNPRVLPSNLGATICRGGYTSSIRPPEEITGREKAANARAYGYTGPARTVEYDHLVSLELGGDPNDPRNLWVEPNDRPGATGTTNSKDAVENAAHAAVCSGRIGLRAAQAAIASDWVRLGADLGVPLPAR